MNDGYFNKLLDIIDGENYECLMRQLYNIDFYSNIKLDQKVVENARGMRYDLGAVNIDEISVLEIFVVLAIDAERKIMHNTAFGNRTADWFWMIMRNLHLDKYTDDIYDDRIAEIITSRIDVFLSREYAKNGVGGAFVTNSRKDMRKYDLWRQMNWQLSELYSDEFSIDVV